MSLNQSSDADWKLLEKRQCSYTWNKKWMVSRQIASPRLTILRSPIPGNNKRAQGMENNNQNERI